MWYSVWYPTPSVVHSKSKAESMAFVWADSPEDLERILRERNQGEHTPTAAPHMTARRWSPVHQILQSDEIAAHKLHSLIWISNMALACGLVNRQTLLADEGMLHLASHYLDTCAVYPIRSRKKLWRRIYAIEASIPGHFSPKDLDKYHQDYFASSTTVSPDWWDFI